MESAFAGAALSISSTMIISKLFDERGERGPLRELVFAVLVTEDLLAILLLALLSGASVPGSFSGAQTALTLGRLVLFMAALVGVGMLLVPRFIRWVDDLGRPESLLVASMGLCFALALLAAHFGYSVALGASSLGCGGRGGAEQVDCPPFRDLFAAIFFVAVGMMIDPRAIPPLWKPILVFSLLVAGGKLLMVSISVALAGQPMRRALGAGLAMTQIGEFGFILVTAGVDLEAVRPSLCP
ncbi:MAG: cation:proton antiporter [Holophagaceae bacterium]|nr:cation:proton antiporter [Holophagaceae bacterium]